jgi:hypothetical protein
MQLTIWNNEELDAMSNRVTLIYVDKVNLNGRVYNEETAKKIVSDFSEKKAFGEFVRDGDQTQLSDVISISNMSHYISEIVYEKEKGIVSGNLTLLQTPVGEYCKSLLSTGKYVVRSRGIGTVEESGIVKIDKIIAFDIISAENDSFANYTDKTKNTGII